MTIEFDAFTTDPAPGGQPRRRVAAALGATMLVAAAGGIGFGLGQNASDNAELAPADQPASTDAAGSASDSATDAPVTPATIAPVEPVATEPVEAMTESAVTESEGDAIDIIASGGGGWSMFGDQPMQLLLERTTDTGVLVRAHLGETWEQEYNEFDDFGGPEGWRPPAWCFESGQVRIALGGGASTGADVIDVGSVSWWNEPYEGRAVSHLTMGAVDGNPHRVVFVQAPADVDSVSVTFGDGATDSTTPSNGVALLVVPGAPETIVHEDGDYTWIEYVRDFDVTFNASQGEAINVDGRQSGWEDPAFQASCSPPPPALPEPGEQPADADVQEQVIVELMALIYSNDDSAENANRIDDPTGIAEAREQVRAGGFEEAAASAAAIVEELVFTSPTEAWFRYRIETTTGTFDQRFGIAVDIDGQWKITRNTICQDLSLAGGDCGGNVEMIRPPGS